METLLKLFYANLLILTIFQPAIAVSKVELFGGHTGVSVLEAFNLENWFHVVAELAPIDSVI